MVILQLNEQPPLIQAIFAGDLDGTRELLNNKVDVNFQDSDKRTALHASAFRADASIAAVLLEAGARPNAKDAKWITPLHRACSVNAFNVVDLLLSYKADVSARDRFWQTPLHVAALNNAYESLELLLDHVPNIDVTDRSGKTALHHAAYNGRLYIADLLISRGCVVNASDKKYFRPLHCAAQMGHVDTIDLLIKCGADVNASDWNQYTPLHVAAANGNDSVCRLLINAGANVDSQNTYGNTPLHIACLNGQQLVCQDLINSGADPEAINFRGQTPIHIAAASAHGTDCMMYLLSQKVDVNKRSLDGRTPLHMTAIHGRFTRSKSLIDQGAIVDCTDKNKCTPLHIAAQYGHDLLANTLMCYGANPSFKGHEGRTPLHMCCLSGFVECCRKFLVAGVDLNALDDSGRTPLHCAAYKGSVECLDLLVSNGAKFLEKDNIGRLPLHYSGSQGHYQCVFTLVGIGSPTNAEDDQGCTPLHLAAGYDKEGKCVEYLLKHGADPLKKDRRGYTPFHYAAAGSNTNGFGKLLGSTRFDNIQDRSKPTQVTPLHLAAKLGNNPILQGCVKNGAYVDVQDDLGITPLMVASREGHWQCVEYLVRYEADITICDKTNNMTAVHYSAKNGHYECLVEMFKTEGGKQSINMADSLQRTPLMLAVSSNHIDCVRAILDNSLDVEKTVNTVDADSHSSLFRAVVFGQSKIVQLLLTKNAKANLADVNGKKVIHLAAACGHLTCLQTLVEFLEPEDRIAKDGQECTALHWACYKGNTSCVGLLLETDLFKTIDGNKFSPVHCASFSGSVHCLQLLVNYYGTDIIHLQDARKRYPLHICALHGHNDAAKYLLDQGAEVDVLDEDERTPFIAAAQFGQNQIIELLLTYKVNKTYQDKYGNTALHWACLMKHNSTALLLLKDLDDCNVIHSTNKENKTALHFAARNGLVDVTRELLKKGASVFAVDSEGYTPALCCAPNNQVAQCLALILLNLKMNPSEEENDSKQTLNSFLEKSSRQIEDSSKYSTKIACQTQTTSNLSKTLNTFDDDRFFNETIKTSLSNSNNPSSSSLTIPLFRASWRKDHIEGKQVPMSEGDCFLVENSEFHGNYVPSNGVGANVEIQAGLNLHRSFSEMSIFRHNETKINLEESLRVQNLKELSDRKKECKVCSLWQKRCTDCTFRHVLRNHLQGKTSPKEFNEFLMKALSDTSTEYRQKLLHALERIGSEFEKSRNTTFAPNIRHVMRLEKTRSIFSRNRSRIPFDRTQLRMDTRELATFNEKINSFQISQWIPIRSSMRSGGHLFNSEIIRSEVTRKFPRYVGNDATSTLCRHISDFDIIPLRFSPHIFGESIYKERIVSEPNLIDKIHKIELNFEKYEEEYSHISNYINKLLEEEVIPIVKSHDTDDINQSKILKNFLNNFGKESANHDAISIENDDSYDSEEWGDKSTEPLLAEISNFPVSNSSKSIPSEEETCIRIISVAMDQENEDVKSDISECDYVVTDEIDEQTLLEDYIIPPKNIERQCNDDLEGCLNIISVQFLTEDDGKETTPSKVYMVEKSPSKWISKNCEKIAHVPFVTEKDVMYISKSTSTSKTKLKSKKEFSCTLC